MLAVCAPNTMRFFSVLWRNFSGEKRWGKAFGMTGSGGHEDAQM